MAAKNTKTAELSDIPLTLEQGDSVEMSTTKSQKIKTNSMKRFFRKPTSSKSSDPVDTDNPEVKNAVSLQLRFGTFRKNEAVKRVSQVNANPADMEAGSSKSQPPPATESRLNLQERLSNYWSTVFKKSSKKSPTPEIMAQEDTPSSTAAQSVAQNPSDTNQ